MEDDIIRKKIIDQLAWDSRINIDPIRVDVKERVVTLTGEVPSFRVSKAIEQNVWTINGVKSVNNKLIVKPEVDIQNISDKQLSIEFHDKLFWDPDINPENITIKANNGWLELDGSVDAYWKRAEIEKAAESLRGVRGVTNNLKVVPKKTITDEEVGTSVQRSLERNNRVDASKVNVTVKDGEVLLSGIVKDKEAKDAALGSAYFTVGTKNVTDKLQIDFKIEKSEE